MLKKHTLPLKDTSLFSGLFTDYINAQDQVKPFYDFHINLDGYKAYFKQHSFNDINREVLVKSLTEQAALVNNTSGNTQKNIQSLSQANTFTVTTGHQLCLFTGPLYFVYKIISTINLCKTLKQQFPDKEFVPVYWMASEDHDFEEINHVNVFGKKISWNSEQTGSVGDFTTPGLADVIAELKTILGESDHAKELIALFEKAYLQHSNLADATRYLTNELFGEYGLVSIDGNDKALKQLFVAEFKADIFENKPYQLVEESIRELREKNYSVQVNPREVNVFYKDKGLRERIEKNGDAYKVVNTDLVFTKAELENLITTSPEKMSPNVVLRPLYQQKILPNIAYVGGPGELAYWLEYKKLFTAFQLNFPILMPRNFVLFIDKNTQGKLQKLNLTITDVFKDGEELVKQLIKTQHDDINLEDAKQQMAVVFGEILNTVSAIDKTLAGTTEAEKQKAINGISAIEQKINRALKQKSETDVNQIWAMKQKLFPNNTPQERHDNISMYYSKYGKEFITELAEQLAYNLEGFEYTVLTEE